MTTNALPTSMPAWQLHSGGDVCKSLKLNQTAPVPQLKTNQTLVRVLATSLNPVDHKVVELPVVGYLAVSRPCTPGMDFCGRVWATTLPDSAGFKAGDVVYGQLPGPAKQGALAGFTVVDGLKGIVKAPAGVEAEQLACLGVAGLTAYQSLIPYLGSKAGDGKGKTVFINGGSGGTGTFGVQIAKKVLGCTVITACSGGNTDLVRELGADVVIDYKTQNVAETLKEYAKANGKIDLVVDNVGTDVPALYWPAHHFMRPEGTHVQVGAQPGLSFGLQMAKVFLVPGFLGGGKRKFNFIVAKLDSKHLEQLGQWMKEGKLKAVIEDIFPMEEATKAFARLKTGRTRGKVVVRVNESG